MTPMMLIPATPAPATSAEAPRAAEPGAASFLALLSAALPAKPSATQLPEQAVAQSLAPPTQLQPPGTGIEQTLPVAATPALPQIAAVAATLHPQKPVALTSTTRPVTTKTEQPDAESPAPPVTPDVIAALIATMIPPTAPVASKPAATPATPSAVTATPATAMDGGSAARGRMPEPPQATTESVLAQALAIVTEKTPEHASAVAALSSIVADANPAKSQTLTIAPEQVAVATTSSFALPALVTQAVAPQSPDASLQQQMVQIAIPVLVDHPQWGQAVGEQLVMMAVHQGRHTAELRLDPPNLGPVSVQIDVNGNQAKLTFVAPVSQTCDALAQSLPDLKSAFSAQGMTLTQASISQQQTNPQQQGQGGATPSRQDARAGESSTSEIIPIRVITSRGLVDEYA